VLDLRPRGRPVRKRLPPRLSSASAQLSERLQDVIRKICSASIHNLTIAL